MIFELITDERARQDKKWGQQFHSHEKWLVILAEEVGEVARAIFEQQEEPLVTELVQVAAVCVAWLERMIEPEPQSRDQITDRIDELWEELDELEKILKNWLSFSDAKAEFLGIFEDIIPEHDDTMHREAWNNWTDALCKDGRITTEQYEEWDNPF